MSTHPSYTRFFRAVLSGLVVFCVAQSANAQSRAASYDPVTMDPPIRDTVNPPSREELAFSSHGSRLNGLMYTAQGAGPHPTVILLHGYPGVERNLDLAQAIRRGGINVLYFNYRGSWGSEGAFSFANAQEDVQSAIGYLRTPDVARRLRIDPARIALVGHSMGGWLAFLGAAADRSIQCVGGLEASDMTYIRGEPTPSPRTDSAFIAYANTLTAPGGPLRASSESLLASLKVNAEAWTLPHHAAELSGRTLFLLDNNRNAGHARFVASLKQAGARHLTQEVWNTDHTFSDRRIALGHRVLGWLHSDCGY
ncbi:MAG: alpha/beta fold hydrolase [Gemmatimonadota bacterium]|nr:alpha/beta fold hydrolase [Gemmatimonadota bacterium]